MAIPQNKYKKHTPIGHLMPRGAQADLARKFNTSRTYVNGVVHGAVYDGKIYEAALEVIEQHQAETERLNARAKQLAG